MLCMTCAMIKRWFSVVITLTWSLQSSSPSLLLLNLLQDGGCNSYQTVINPLPNGAQGYYNNLIDVLECRHLHIYSLAKTLYSTNSRESASEVMRPTKSKTLTILQSCCLYMNCLMLVDLHGAVPEPVYEPVHDEDDGEVLVRDLAQPQHRHDDHHLYQSLIICSATSRE